MRAHVKRASYVIKIFTGKIGAQIEKVSEPDLKVATNQKPLFQL